MCSIRAAARGRTSPRSCYESPRASIVVVSAPRRGEGEAGGDGTRVRVPISQPPTQNRHARHQASAGHGPVADGHRPRAGGLTRNRRCRRARARGRNEPVRSGLGDRTREGARGGAHRCAPRRKSPPASCAAAVASLATPGVASNSVATARTSSGLDSMPWRSSWRSQTRALTRAVGARSSRTTIMRRKMARLPTCAIGCVDGCGRSTSEGDGPQGAIPTSSSTTRWDWCA